MRTNLLSKATVLGISLLTFQARAQQNTAELKREMLREMWKEKTSMMAQPTGMPSSQKQGAAASANKAEVKVSTNTTAGVSEAEVFVAVDPTNEDHLVLSYMRGGSNLSFPVYTSNNGGLTWSQSSINTASILNQDFPGHLLAGGGDPVFAFDSNGKLYFSWIYLTVNSAFDTAYMNMYWAWSDDGGLNFQLAPGQDRFIGRGALDPMTFGTYDVLDGIFDRQWFDVDRSGGPNDGRLYCSTVFWPNSVTSQLGDGVVIKYKDATATAFGAHVPVLTGVGQFANVQVDQGDGSVHVSMCDINLEQVVCASSPAGGQSFGSVVMVHQGNNLFGPPSGTMVHGRENAASNLAVDGAGNLHLVWGDYFSQAPHAFYSRSTDAGATWSPAMDLSQLFPGHEGFMPTVSAAGNRVDISIHVIDSANNSNFHVVSSMDNGATFSAFEQMSNAVSNYRSYNLNTFFGDYNKSVSTNCRTITTWSDGRNNSGPKVYVGLLDHCGANPFSAPEWTAVNGELQVGSPYPNPGTDRINLEVEAMQAGILVLRVFDLQGKQILEEERSVYAGANNLEVNSSSWSSGTYLLEITHNGDRFVRRAVRK